MAYRPLKCGSFPMEILVQMLMMMIVSYSAVAVASGAGSGSIPGADSSNLCYNCHYGALSTEVADYIPGEQRFFSLREKSLESYMHKMCIKRENLTSCDYGVTTCVLSFIEERFRLNNTAHDLESSGYVMSHFCGEKGNTEAGCTYEHTNAGASILCVCRGTACNTGFNEGRILVMRKMVGWLALTVAFAVSEMLTP